MNVLYLALGMLHWRDAEDPKRELKAPLLLVPVKLQRAAVRERYKLSYTGDHIEENLSLAFKLKQDFAAELPPFPEIEDMDPKVYFEAVRQAVSGLQNWEVQDDEIYLGFFSFTKLMMMLCSFSTSRLHWFASHEAAPCRAFADAYMFSSTALA